MIVTMMIVAQGEQYNAFVTSGKQGQGGRGSSTRGAEDKQRWVMMVIAVINIIILKLSPMSSHCSGGMRVWILSENSSEEVCQSSPIDAPWW